MNTVTVCGNCTELVLRYTKGEKAVLSFSLALNRKVNGEQVTTWVSCKAWESLAENLATHCSKGDRLLVSGYLEQEEWEQDGEKKSRVVLVANEAGKSLRWTKEA